MNETVIMNGAADACGPPKNNARQFSIVTGVTPHFLVLFADFIFHISIETN